MSLTLLAGILGSVVATLAIAVDAADRFAPAARPALSAMGGVMRFRRDKNAAENLRQGCIVLGAAILLLYSYLAENPVFVGLEVLLVLSGVLWYVNLSKDEKTSESVKSWLRLAVAVAVGVGLWAAGFVHSFHWLGIIGLEVLGCAFVLARPVWLRDGVTLAGGLCLLIYPLTGMLLDPSPEKFEGYAVFFGLNLVFSVFAGVVFMHTLISGHDGGEVLAQLPEREAA